MNWLSVPYQNPGGLSPADDACSVVDRAAGGGIATKLTAHALAATTIGSNALRPTSTA